MSAISEEPARPTVVSVNDPDVRVFIGPNADKLVGKLRLLDEWMASPGTRIFAAINFVIWPAVFLGAVWYFYRRMYLVALLTIAAMVLLGVALEYYSDGAGSRNSALSIVIGLLAPYAYHSHIKRKVARIRQETSTPAERELRLRRAGGVDWISPSILIAVVAGLLWLAVTA